MEDEKGSQPIEQQPQTQGANIPPPENGPTGENAAQVRNQNEDNRIANLEDKMRSAERIMSWLTGAIALFALGSVIVALLQWKVMNGQLKEMHDGGVDTHNLAMATKDAADLNRILAEGSAAAWLIPSEQELNRNFLSFGVQNMGGVAAENVGVSVEVKLNRLSNSQTLWTESFTLDIVRYLPPKQNTNEQGVLTISKYTRQDFERITKEQEVLILNWTATYDNGFKRQVQQKGCAQYLALFKPPEVRAMPQWVGCEGAPQLLRQLQAPSEQWSLQ